MRSQTAPRTALPRTTGRRPDVSVRAWLRLARVYHKVEQAALEDIRREGLSMGQFDVLAHVGAAEGSTQQQIADALLVTARNVYTNVLFMTIMATKMPFVGRGRYGFGEVSSQ